MYEIKQKFISMNRSKKPLIPRGIVVHETANPGGTAEMHHKYFNSANRKASAHAFVDWNEIIHTIPWNEQAGHAGSYANNRYLGIELCRPKKHDPFKFSEVWKRGIWLFANLYINELNISNITKDNLLSHDEIRIRFGGTNHTDPVAYFNEYGYTVDDFRKSVQNQINKMLQLKELTINEAIDYLHKKGYLDSPVYWLQNAVLGKMIPGEIAAFVLIKWAKSLMR